MLIPGTACATDINMMLQTDFGMFVELQIRLSEYMKEQPGFHGKAICQI